MKKVILISPYSNLNSYGIRSISTYLRTKGIKVTTIYLLNRFDRAYPKKVLEQLVKLCFGADLIGLSVMSNYFNNSVQITKKLKERLDIPIVWGGIHPIISHKNCLDYCDIVVLKDGEKAMLDILNSNIKHGTVKSQPVEVVIDNDFSSDYVLYKGKITKLTYKLLSRYMTSDYVTLTSFGCPFKCSYCINSNKYYKDGMRFRKIDDVISELSMAITNMPFIKHISFDDDAFLLRDDLEEFAVKYKKKIGLPFFVSGVNPSLVTNRKIRILIWAGMNRIKMGIQSGSSRTKQLYNRNTPNDMIIKSANTLNRYKEFIGLVGYDIILDNPFEDDKDIIETIKFISKLPAPFTLNLFSLTIFEGTELYEKAKLNNCPTEISHYHKIGNTYLNLILVLFTIIKVPDRLLNILLKKNNFKVPRILFKMFELIGFARRGINFLIKKDYYTLLRHIRLNVNQV